MHGSVTPGAVWTDTTRQCRPHFIPSWVCGGCAPHGPGPHTSPRPHASIIPTVARGWIGALLSIRLARGSRALAISTRVSSQTPCHVRSSPTYVPPGQPSTPATASAPAPAHSLRPQTTGRAWPTAKAAVQRFEQRLSRSPTAADPLGRCQLWQEPRHRWLARRRRWSKHDTDVLCQLQVRFCCAQRCCRGGEAAAIPGCMVRGVAAPPGPPSGALAPPPAAPLVATDTVGREPLEVHGHDMTSGTPPNVHW